MTETQCDRQEGVRKGQRGKWLPLLKRILKRVIAKGCLLRGREVRQVCRGLRTKGYVGRPWGAMAAIPQWLRRRSCRPGSPTQQSSTICTSQSF